MSIKLNQLKPKEGSKKRRKIVGRGEGSGHGGSSTRGMKGQKSRSGGGVRPGFEGGQMPLLRRIPKRGFSNKKFRNYYEIVNLKTLDERFEPNAEITKEILFEKGIIKKRLPLKILGDGELTKPLKIKANKFSKSAIEKIKKSGGEVLC